MKKSKRPKKTKSLKKILIAALVIISLVVSPLLYNLSQAKPALEANQKFVYKSHIISNPDLYAVKNWMQVQLRVNDKKVDINIPEGLSDQQLIEYVDNWANAKVKAMDDSVNYGVPDYWATPEESLKNGGDCEDYTILKYFILKQHGINPSDMFLVGVYDSRIDGYHAILMVTLNGKTYILDNRHLTKEYRDKYYETIVLVNDFMVILPEK